MTPGHPRALLVDLGNVLVGFDHGITTTRLEAATGVPAEVIRPHLFGPLERELDSGRIATAAFFRAVETAAGLPRLPDPLWVEAWRDIFWPIPEALEALARVRPGVARVLVSNTNPLHWEGVQRVCDVAARVDALCLSFEVGAVKPEARIWEAALARAGASPEAAVLADDRAVLVEGARAHGIDAFLVDGPGAFVQGLRARGLLRDAARESRGPADR